MPMPREKLLKFIFDMIRKNPKTPEAMWKAIRAHPDYEAFAKTTLAEVFQTLDIGDLIDISEAIP
jgi:hypothetical protein